MRKLIVFVFCLMFPFFSTSQIEDPTTWSFDVEELGDGSYKLLANVKIDKGWHIYSQYKNPESFIVSTSFYFKNIDGINFIDSEPEKVDFVNGFKVFFTEDNPIEKFVPIQDEIARYFEDNASFFQKVEVQDGITQIDAMYEFMVCDDQQCLPPEIVDITFSLKKKELTKNEETLSHSNDNFDCSNQYNREIKGLNSLVQEEENSSIIKILEALLAGIIAGLIALVTPCVFPMIPLTVSFFLKGSEDRRKSIMRATMYGGFIVLIYFLLSLPFHFFSLDAEILNQISTNVWLNLIFFFVFTIFAISFFGYFEIRLPSKLLNKVDSASEVGGAIGIFFMALTLALVSFSCTGPVLGAALAKTGLTASGSGSAVALQLSSAMIGFGLALGVPFALFAVFPTWLKSLPKSGGWMNTFKVFIGFLEVALAIKFLSNADAVYKLGLIKYETFFVLWSITFLCLALYLFGVIRFPHDEKGKKIGSSRIAFGLLTLFFVIYLLPGISCKYQDVFTHTLFGLPPPKTYSYCNEDPSEVINLSNDRIVTKDYFEAIELSKKHKKPILVDFTGMACVNCRKLENQIWNDAEVDNLISQYILAQLYVDIRKEVPEHKIDECYADGSWKKSKIINTTGKQWSTLQTLTFGKNTQPLHIILKPSEDPNYDEELLKDKNGNYFQPKAYKDANSIDVYRTWLEQGLNDFYSE
tara:strand:- start:68834 stop:70924 length:2091 start_codon:yes stop_codon:yes gene_type:complete